MNIEKEIFKEYKVDFNKLLENNFKKLDNKYIYEKLILNNSFKVLITIDDNSLLEGKIVDLSTNIEYTNYRLSTGGEFSNIVKTEYVNILKEILDKCYKIEEFLFEQSNRISKLIKDKYDVKAEFLWEKYPNFGVFRNKDSNKWFAIIMNVDKSKLDKKLSGTVDVINLKVNDLISKYVGKPGIYTAYHMNKKYWCSVILDDTLSDKDIFNLIEISYNLSKKV